MCHWVIPPALPPPFESDSLDEGNAVIVASCDIHTLLGSCSSPRAPATHEGCEALG